MEEYYRLVAILQSSSSQQMQDQSLADETAVSASINTESSRQTLTLRKLLVWTHEPVVRLKMMALMVDAAAVALFLFFLP